MPVQATDDWPFLYLRTPTIQPHYLAALGFVLLFALVAVAGSAAVTRTPLRGFSPHFFVLGTAFMLLETRSLVSFSLLFGTTWLVNALAFFAILASVLVAILVNSRLKVRRSRPLYVLLFAALAVAFAAAAGAASARSALAALLAGRGRGFRPRLPGQPRLHVLLQGYEDRGHGLREQPARRDGRRRDRVPGPHHRLPVRC